MILIGIIMTKKTEYDPDDPEDVASLVIYVLSTMARDRLLPRNYELDDCLGMAYFQALNLCKTFDPKKGHSFESYMFTYLPGRFFDYFTINEVGKKKNLTRTDGRVHRPKDEPRFVDKAMTNFPFQDGESFEVMLSYNGCSVNEPHDKKIVFSDLNKKQMDVVYFIAKGITQRRIGNALKISESRVCQIRNEVRTKCRLESKAYVLEDNEYSV